jgi:hypothetical protein
VPETKSLTLEELSDVFVIPLAEHASHGVKQARAFFDWCLVELEHIKHGFAEEEAKGPVDDVL